MVTFTLQEKLEAARLVKKNRELEKAQKKELYSLEHPVKTKIKKAVGKIGTGAREHLEKAITSRKVVKYRPILKKEPTQTIRVRGQHYEMVAPSFNFQQTKKNMLEWGMEGR